MASRKSDSPPARKSAGKSARMPARKSAPATLRPRKGRSIDLALQGGGSHGAFTWGVLDRLLEEPWLHLDGVSGTSAGALNAAVLATGLATGGREGARAALRDFWEDVAGGGACFGSVPGSAGSALPGMPSMSSPGLPTWPGFDLSAALWSPLTQWVAEFTRLVSPYQFNPLDINPLREIVRRHVDLAALKRGALWSSSMPPR